MSTEVVSVVQQAGPYLSAALAAYGGAVLIRAESAAVDATANVGRRILQLVWGRRHAPEQAAFEEAVQEAAAALEDADAAAALRQQIKRALREDADLVQRVAALLPATAPVSNIAAGTRAVAAQYIGVAVTGDNNQVNE
ncbi:hypothetical protein ACIQU1_01015 [Streptomyces angustmyceticus]|uniref:hypothetical protein n=1 Tax=Streptomyces angustmyceticus TaxID=285578 RepID=UPI003808DE36